MFNYLKISSNIQDKYSVMTSSNELKLLSFTNVYTRGSKIVEYPVYMVVSQVGRGVFNEIFLENLNVE